MNEQNKLPTKDPAFPDESTATHTRRDEDWSASREHKSKPEKLLMADHFVRHRFLVRDGLSPESHRDTVASIILNHGTTPNCVVHRVVEWIQKHPTEGPFFLIWYTPGHLIPTTLTGFRERAPALRTALKLFLFPGEVDEETQSVLGTDAELFAKQLRRHFTYAILSAYSFDVATGDVYFYFPRELGLQRACATRSADHKFLFLDPSKFKSEGEQAYSIFDLLQTCESVTIYTVHSANSKWISEQFIKLTEKLLAKSNTEVRHYKTLRLQIVGRDEATTTCIEKTGILIARNKRLNSGSKKTPVTK